jgi:hypothetical protein
MGPKSTYDRFFGGSLKPEAGPQSPNTPQPATGGPLPVLYIEIFSLQIRGGGIGF